MKIKFVGAINHITGSCNWLKYSKTGVQFLVDCGMHQGASVEHLNEEEFPFNPAEIKFVLLTHAHIDHCGLIPKLYRDGFSGEVYATSATVKLAKIGLSDAAKHGDIYEKKDVDEIKFVCIDDDNQNITFTQKEYPYFFWGNSFYVDKNLSVAFQRSSHILGSASVTVNWNTATGESGQLTLASMCFSGDIGNNTKELSYLPLMKPNKYPFPGIKYLLVESTYGHDVREEKFKSAKNRQKELWRIIRQAREKQGKILIPVFSIHRSQEVLIDLIATLKAHANEVNIDGNQGWKILCHSPMIAKVCQVYAEELTRSTKGRNGKCQSLHMSDGLLEYIREDSPEVFNYLFGKNKRSGSSYKFNGASQIVITENKPKNSDEYDIIVASSGMCAAGPIKTYLQEYETDPATTIVLTGYQASPEGKKIQNHATNSPEEPYAKVENMSRYYSGHADQDTLLDYIFNVSGVPSEKNLTSATVFINHGGDTSSKEKLKLAIEERAKKSVRQRPIKKIIVADKSEQWFNLTSGTLEEITTTDLLGEIRILQRQVRALSRLLKNITSTTNKSAENRTS